MPSNGTHQCSFQIPSIFDCADYHFLIRLNPGYGNQGQPQVADAVERTVQSWLVGYRAGLSLPMAFSTEKLRPNKVGEKEICGGGVSASSRTTRTTRTTTRRCWLIFRRYDAAAARLAVGGYAEAIAPLLLPS